MQHWESDCDVPVLFLLVLKLEMCKACIENTAVSTYFLEKFSEFVSDPFSSHKTEL